jgi:type I restriction enzyme, S subunit
MIDGLKPYPAMKDSGVPWLGAVPEHWSVSRADSVLEPRKSPIQPSDIADERVLHYSIPSVQRYGGGSIEPGASVDSGKLLVDRPLLLVSKLNPRKGSILLGKV